MDKVDEGSYKQINKIFFVRCATTANITIATDLNNGDTLDGITLATGDLVLVKNQTTGSENGIYVVSASPARWTRYNTDATIRGSQVYVKEGTVNLGKTYFNSNSSTITIGSTEITYVAFVDKIFTTYEGKKYTINSPYRALANQAKIQMHCHSNASDGVDTPTALVTAYKNASYDGITITDHDIITTDPSVSGIVWLGNGVEETNSRHLTAYDIASQSTSTDLQACINYHRLLKQMCSIAHPNWVNTPISTIEANGYYDFNMIEVYNAITDTYGEAQWDSILSAGKKVWGQSVDDCHNVATATNFNVGWDIVNCATKTKDEILLQYRNGNFYASKGNDITITVIGNVITASSTASSNITFIGRNGVVFQTNNGVTSASYTIRGDEMYIRCKSILASDSTKMAWSQPVFLDTLLDDSRNESDLWKNSQKYVDTDTILTISSMGNFGTIQKAFDYLSRLRVSSSSYVTVEVGDGVFTSASPLTWDFISGSRMKLVGKNSYTKTINSISSVGSWVSDGSFYYRDVVLNMSATVTNVATGDYALISDTTGGVYPELIRGCHYVVSVSGSTITVRIWSNTNHSYTPSGNVTTTACEIIKTVIECSGNYDVLSVYGGIGGIGKIVFRGSGQSYQAITFKPGSYGFFESKTGHHNTQLGFNIDAKAQVYANAALFGSKCGQCVQCNGTLYSGANYSHCWNGWTGTAVWAHYGATVRMPTSTSHSGSSAYMCNLGAQHVQSSSVAVANTGYGFNADGYAGIIGAASSSSFLNGSTDYNCSGGSHMVVTGYATVTITGTTSTSNKLITSMTNTNYLKAGMAISGTGIPSGATIATVDSGTQITFTASGNGTANGANAHTYTPTFSPAVNTVGNSNSYIQN